MTGASQFAIDCDTETDDRVISTLYSNLDGARTPVMVQSIDKKTRL